MGTVRPLPHQCKRSAQRVGRRFRRPRGVRGRARRLAHRPVSLRGHQQDLARLDRVARQPVQLPDVQDDARAGLPRGLQRERSPTTKSPSSTVTLQGRNHDRWRGDPLGQRGLRREPSDCPRALPPGEEQGSPRHAPSARAGSGARLPRAARGECPTARLLRRSSWCLPSYRCSFEHVSSCSTRSPTLTRSNRTYV